MINFLTLTLVLSEKPIFINPAQIVSFEITKGNRSRIITTNDSLYVKESPGEIIEQIWKMQGRVEGRKPIL